ncbi:hypothetical protein MN0502_22970 [Arthrobacter sp. MN05-02]|nr:hypothetical protein MN0502_22970 [Arthrobacter sp. MN05-02]
MNAPLPVEEAVLHALTSVIDPELRRPITELGMVDAVAVEGRTARVRVLLTIAGCPLRDTIRQDTEAALSDLDGVDDVEVELGVMDQAQRDALKEQLKGAGGRRGIPFNEPSSLTRVYAVASGKGGVGKSSVTVNLAVAMAAQGAPRRDRGRRRLRVLGPRPPGHHAAAHPRRRTHPAARRPRREGHLHRDVRRRQPAHLLARADAAPGARAVPDGRVLR